MFCHNVAELFFIIVIGKQGNVVLRDVSVSSFFFLLCGLFMFEKIIVRIHY